MIDTKTQQLGTMFGILAEELDLPDQIYQEMVRKYQHLGHWIKLDSKDRFRADAEIYPQGSVNLGTAIPPVKTCDGYDLDLVYRRDLAKSGISQADLMMQTGDQLTRYIAYLRAQSELVPELIQRRRCWALNYEGRFHMDVLPAIPDDEPNVYSLRNQSDAILITDRELRAWQHSNPKGFADWFYEKDDIVLPEQRRLAAKTFNVEVENIPIERVKTPLRQTIQLLKRHRDIRYIGNPDDKPISIIITTLAAMAYTNYTDTFEAVDHIVRNMRNSIKPLNGGWSIPNPINPKENFADKWNEHPQRANRFFEWLAQVEADLGDVQQQIGIHQFAKSLSPMFGNDIVERSIEIFGRRMDQSQQRGDLRMAAKTGTLGSAGIVVPKNTWYGEE